MTKEVMGNYLRAHRRRCGLSQRELGILVGYGHAHAVSKQERSKNAPPLLIAMAYEIVFEIPIGQLFTGFHSEVARSVKENMQDLRVDMEQRKVKPSPEKEQWLRTQRIG